ncbi:HeH/LEM domain-containing protein [Pseudomonas sp. PB3P13]
MTKNNVWYLPGPFHRYEDDVKAIAKKNDLIIIDANVTPDRDDETDKPPKAKLKPEFAEAEAETDPVKMGVAELREWLAAKGVEFDAKAPKADLVKLIPAE